MLALLVANAGVTVSEFVGIAAATELLQVLVQRADQAHRSLLVPCDIDQAEIRVDAYIDALRRKPTVGPERREMSA